MISGVNLVLQTIRCIAASLRVPLEINTAIVA
jgi:hypothetical protein